VAFQVEDDFRTHGDTWNRFIRTSFWSAGVIVVALAILGFAIF